MSNPYDCSHCHNEGYDHAPDCPFHPDNLAAQAKRETCQQCLDRWGQEPSEWGDSSLELIAYFKHRVFHLKEEVELPPFWKDEILDEETR
jgi:hypothetical protein